MGLAGSKMWDEMSEESKPSTPISRKPLRILEIDPRSPSSGISRTPIQVEKTPTNSKVTSVESNATSPLERPMFHYRVIDDSRSPSSHHQRISVNACVNAGGEGKIQKNKERNTDNLDQSENEGSYDYKNESKLREDCPKPLLKTTDRTPLASRINVNSLCVRLLHQQLEEKKKPKTRGFIQEDKEN
ncbi:cell division cycle-associated protein 3-like isoform X2 [Limulus polyphemus]|nr:cell division cycle-associated protein 3-like isoform X2 [Limulus polyphemus]